MNISKSPHEFLHAILESFVDGILVLTEQQEALYANETAKQLCHQLTGSLTDIPKEVWQACEALIDSRDVYPEHQFVMEQEVNTDLLKLRIRVQWLSLKQAEQACLVIRLQDQNQAFRGLAIAEAQAWGLTERETQVWVLRRCGWPRKEIASQLFIALDTVKKHLRNIQAKRQSHLANVEDWQMNPPEPLSKLFCSV